MFKVFKKPKEKKILRREESFNRPFSIRFQTFCDPILSFSIRS